MGERESEKEKESWEKRGNKKKKTGPFPRRKG